MPKNLKGSVGAGGSNRPVDVITVQYLLNCVPAKLGGPSPELSVDGIVGPLTRAAILRFQEAQTGRCDGRVDPNGPAIQRLQGFDPLPNLPLPLPVMSPATQKTVAEVIVRSISEMVAKAAAKAAGMPPSHTARTGTGGMTGAILDVVKKVAETTAKTLEEAAKTTGIPMPPLPDFPNNPGFPGGIGGLIRKVAEDAKRTAEAAAKQGGLPLPPGGFDFPNNPGFPGGIEGIVKKVSETVAKVAKGAGTGIPPSGGFDFPNNPGFGGIGGLLSGITKVVEQSALAAGKSAEIAAKWAKSAGKASGKS